MIAMMCGTLMEVRKPNGEFVWLAILDDASGRFWVYDFTTRKFHMNKWLTLDYEVDRELNYVAIDRARGLEIVTTKNREINNRVREEHVADRRAVSVDQVLGSDSYA